MKNAIRNLTLTLAGALLFVPFAQGAVSTAQNKDGLTSLEKGVRHELVMLPWFGVFDNLEFQVNGDEVVLSGHVTRPTLKTDAGRVVSRIEGVAKVVNNIEVLPLSSSTTKSASRHIDRSTASARCPATTGVRCRRSTLS